MIGLLLEKSCPKYHGRRVVMEGVEQNFVIYYLDFGVGRRGVLDENVEYFDHTS